MRSKSKIKIRIRLKFVFIKNQHLWIPNDFNGAKITQQFNPPLFEKEFLSVFPTEESAESMSRVSWDRVVAVLRKRHRKERIRKLKLFPPCSFAYSKLFWAQFTYKLARFLASTRSEGVNVNSSRRGLSCLNWIGKMIFEDCRCSIK